MAALVVMMISLGFALLNKAIAVLLRRLRFEFGLHGPSKTTTVAALLPRRPLRRASSQSKTVPWPDLPPELLGLVLLRMPTHADRVRFRAVCRQWRSGARQQPLPPLPPLIALRKDGFLSLPDGAVHPMPPTVDISYRLSTGSMLFLVHHDGTCCLTNPFSGETLTTPQKISPDILDLHLRYYSCDQIWKVVVSDHAVVVLTSGKRNSKNVTIFARGPPQGAGSCSAIEWAPPGTGNGYVADIALFQGKLYVLVEDYDEFLKLPELHVLDIDEEQRTSVRSVQCIPSTARGPACCAASNKTNFFYYLVACGDRLLMVERQVDLNTIDLLPTRLCIGVFAAADLGSGGCGGCWSKADTLMGRALFVSPGCSESLPASSGGGIREDCVYFMTERMASLHRQRKPQDDFLDCILYKMQERTVVTLPLETAALSCKDGPWQPTWVFPAVT